MTNHPNRSSRFPDVDAAVGGYAAEIRDTSNLEIKSMRLPGVHDSFAQARARARRAAAALVAAGESGLVGWVAYTGERPAGFPHNGVRA
jgi:hypothetical protein